MRIGLFLLGNLPRSGVLNSDPSIQADAAALHRIPVKLPV
jgi:hypothetical protein